MNLTAKSCLVLTLVLSSLMGLESTFAQVVPDSRSGTRDTVVIIKRDTIVVLQKHETVRIISEVPDSNANSQNQANRYENIDYSQRRRDLRAERRREYEEWYEAQPIVRAGKSWGYKFYPSALGQQDFPSIKFGVERTLDSQFGLEGTLGILIPPNDLWGLGFNREIGTSRFGFRGLDFGFSGRYYLSNVKKRFPFYMEVETTYSISPIEIGIWTSSADGTFEQYIDAPINAQRFSLGIIAGWELRTKEGLLVDLGTGLRLGTKSLKSRNEQVQAIISNTYWNLNNEGATAFANVVIRVGIGYGTWIMPAKEAKSKSRPKAKKKKKRRRR